MSRVKVNEITNKEATGPVDFPDGITGVALTVTGNVTVGGTIISEDTTNVDSVGWVTARSGLNVGPPSTGIGATIHANGNAVFAGICTFVGTRMTGSMHLAESILHLDDTDTAIKFPAGDTVSVETAGSERIRVTSAGKIGIGTDVSGTSEGYFTASILDAQASILLKGTAQGRLALTDEGATSGSKTYDLVSVEDNFKIRKISDNYTGATDYLKITKTGGFNFSNGELIENCNVTAGKLSDNLTINLDNGMVHLFTTTETTTATPNIMSTAGINTSMSNGDAITVTLITTAAAAAYCANIQIDGAAVTENWIGGSAPSAGGSSGVDVHTFSIIKTASETFTVLGNQSTTS